MFKLFIQRENEIFEILESFSDFNFILIGGYAVSAYKHRFSVDADIVIKREDFKKFKKILNENGFVETISKELENIYSTEFKRFEKKKELSVSVDLLIDGMGIRQTGSAISFEKLYENSEIKKIIGIEKEIKVRIPIKEMIIALKVQAGRLTDFRDIVALSEDFDPEKVKELMGGNKQVNENLDKILLLLEEKGFMDSFKGVFMEKKFKPRFDLLRKLV
ncbi:MAG: hypothetical protein V1740_06170 [Candidatus Woesearchaeota archaeon]